MAACDLTIHLDNGKVDYLGGDTVRGEVEVRTDRDIACDGLVVECLWQTHGKGNTDRGEAAPLELFRGEWPAGTAARYPFALRLPHGPFSYHGQLLNVGWLVRARADVPWKLDPKAELDLTLRPAPGAEPQPPPEIARPQAMREELRRRLGGDGAGAPAEIPSKAKAVGIGCVALLILPFAAVAATGIWKVIGVARGTTDVGEALPWMFFGAAVLVVLGLGAARLVRNRIAATRLGEVVFEVEPLVARPGDTLRVRAFCQPRERSQLNRAVLRLEAVEKVIRGSGTSKKTYRHTVHAAEVELAAGRQLNAGLPFQLDHAVAVPADAPPSFHAPDNQLLWVVSLHLDVARWPDWREERALTVYP